LALAVHSIIAARSAGWQSLQDWKCKKFIVRGVCTWPLYQQDAQGMV